MNPTISHENTDLDNLKTLGERLRYLRSIHNLTQAKIVSETGCPKATYSDLENDIAQTSSHLYKIANFLNVSQEWLLTGQNLVSTDVALSNGRVALIPIVEIKLLSGEVTQIENNIDFKQVDVLPLSRNILEKNNLNANQLKAFEVDSYQLGKMAQIGSHLVFDSEDKELRDGAVYIFVFANEVMTRLVNKTGFNRIQLTSTSEKYQSVILEGDEINQIQVLGKIVWHCGAF